MVFLNQIESLEGTNSETNGFNEYGTVLYYGDGVA